jgi:hypothetical protein
MSIIVLSILIAFALDSWRDDKERSAQLAEDLRSVAQEIEANRDLLAFQAVTLRRYVSGTDSLLRLLESHPDSPTVLVQDTLAWTAMAWRTMDPSLGAVEALVASGRLSAIQNPRLRVLLAGLRDQFGDIIEEEHLSQNLHYNTFLPQVRETLDMSFAWRIGLQFEIEQDAQGSLPAKEIIAFPNSLGVRNSMRERSGLYAIAAAEMSVLQAQLEEMLNMLDDLTSNR